MIFYSQKDTFSFFSRLRNSYESSFPSFASSSGSSPHLNLAQKMRLEKIYQLVFVPLESDNLVKSYNLLKAKKEKTLTPPYEVQELHFQILQNLNSFSHPTLYNHIEIRFFPWTLC